MGAYFSKFFPPSLPSEQRREMTNSKLGEDENMCTTWKDLAEYNIRPSESSGRNSRAKESGMNELNKLSAIEAKLDSLIHWMNTRKSSYKLKIEQSCGKNEDCIKRRTSEITFQDNLKAHDGNQKGEFLILFFFLLFYLHVI